MGRGLGAANSRLLGKDYPTGRRLLKPVGLEVTAKLENEMKLVFTTQGTDWESPMDPRFGRTQFLFVYDEERDEIQTYDNTAIGNEAQGAGLKTAQRLSEFDADVLITGNGPGRNAAEVLQITGIRVFMNAGNMTVREAYWAYKNGDLPPASIPWFS